MAGLRELALFAGGGGGILGGHLLGWRTVCAVELDAYARRVLVARQNDGSLLPFPIWDDVRTFDARPWRGCVDVVSGGFPCQDISLAGSGAGIDGERSGLWGDMARIVRDVRPRFVFVENAAALTSRGLDRVLGDLAALRYNAEWCVLGADDCAAPHRRKRIWILGHLAEPASERLDTRRGRVEQARGRRFAGDRCQVVADADSGRRSREWRAEPARIEGPCRREPDRRRPDWFVDAEQVSLTAWPAEPNVGRVAHGVASRVDRLRATGNGQVPRVAAAAFELLRRRGGW